MKSNEVDCWIQEPGIQVLDQFVRIMGPKAIDLFAGAGGLSLGFGFAGIEVVGAVEHDENAVKSYNYNIGNHAFEKDITKFTPQMMLKEMKKQNLIRRKSEIEIICGGPPCPGFSLMGRSKISSLIKSGEWEGSDARHKFIDDKRNKLFLEFVKYVEFFKPKVFVMENVKGMESFESEEGAPIIDIIVDEFKSIGYENIQVKILDSSEYFVPQKRKRIIFIGSASKKKIVHPVAYDSNLTLQDAFIDLPEIDILTGISAIQKLKPMSKISGEKRKSLLRYFRTQKVLQHEIIHGSNSSLHKTRKVNPRDRGIFPLLRSGQEGPRILYKDVYPAMLKQVKKGLPEGYKMLPKSKGYLIVSLDKKKKRKWKWYDREKFGDKMRRMRWDEPGPTVVAHLEKDGYMFVHPGEDRTISVREAARMQSFPDSFDFSAGGEVAFTRQNRQIGNAVPPLLGLAIGQMVMHYLGNEPKMTLEATFGVKPRVLIGE